MGRRLPVLHGFLAGFTLLACCAAAPAQSPQGADPYRILEIKITLAWLEDPALCCYYPCARAENKALRVGGYLPTVALKNKALQIAQARSRLPIVDELTILPEIAVTPKKVASEQLLKNATSTLKTEFPVESPSWELSLLGDGLVAVEGNVRCYEKKLRVSECLRRLAGCVCVVNLLNVTEAGAVVQVSGGRSQGAGVRGQGAGVRNQEAGVRGQESAGRGQESGDGIQRVEAKSSPVASRPVEAAPLVLKKPAPLVERPNVLPLLQAAPLSAEARVSPAGAAHENQPHAVPPAQDALQWRPVQAKRPTAAVFDGKVRFQTAAPRKLPWPNEQGHLTAGTPGATANAKKALEAHLRQVIYRVCGSRLLQLDVSIDGENVLHIQFTARNGTEADQLARVIFAIPELAVYPSINLSAQVAR